MNNTALFIDTFKRDLNVSTVSVTETEFGIVLRYGAEIGKLEDLTATGTFFNYSLPIIVPTRGYQAKSSEGFVSVEAHPNGGWREGCYQDTRISTYVVGIQGMPWMQKKGLRALGQPISVLVLRPGTNISLLPTHGNSNHATAAAAADGIALRAGVLPNSVFITEGQSDYTRAWELTADAASYEFEEFNPEWDWEHRDYMFGSDRLFEAAVRRVAHELGKQVLTMALLKAAYAAGRSANQIDKDLVPMERLLGKEVTYRYAEMMAEAFEGKNWKIGFDLSLANHFTQVVSPEGEVTQGNAFSDWKIKEQFLGISNLHTEEERRDIYTSNLSSRLLDHFYQDWDEGYGHSGDAIVEVHFLDETREVLWFSRGDRKGPQGEEKSGDDRWISSIDSRKSLLWAKMLEIRWMQIILFDNEGKQIAFKEWEAEQVTA